MNISEQDQLFAGLLDMATATFEYYKKLIAAGFNAKQALELTINWQNVMLENSLKK